MRRGLAAAEMGFQVSCSRPKCLNVCVCEMLWVRIATMTMMTSDDVDLQGGSGQGRARRSADAGSGKPPQVS